VAAHGFVNDITIGGRRYSGPQVRQGFRAPGSSAVRQVEDVSPVKVNSPAMVCGTNAAPASEIADATPGDEVLFNWGAAWPHRVGPILTYMASCGDTPCNQFDASQAQWFKIGEQSFKPGTREWFQADLASGRPASARIPSNLAPGNYLIRNEVIALHIAATLGGAEIFPSCTQLRVGGSGNARPSEGELVRFPGAYTQEDPGLWVKDIYEPNFNYVFPGPRVASLVAGGSGG
ncbi:glycoside hydrolase, partial [Coprinopsis sp. MPI-PUGE-AT-0042]